MNLYRAVGNNPVKHTDPSGLVDLLGKPTVRISETIAALDSVAALGAPHKDATNKLISNLNNSNLYKDAHVKFATPAAAGKFSAANEPYTFAGISYAAGDFIGFHVLLFFEWDLSCPTGNETMSFNEKLIRPGKADVPQSGTRNLKDHAPVMKEFPVKAASGAPKVWTLMYGDTPGFRWRRDDGATSYEVKGTWKLDGIPESSIDLDIKIEVGANGAATYYSSGKRI